MLIEFNTSNNRSFKRKNRLSMVATSIKDLEDEAIINLDRVNLLKSVAIYGANASGKSNLLNSMGQMRWLVLTSATESQADDPLGISPYLLDAKSSKKPTSFEMIFIIDKIKYNTIHIIVQPTNSKCYTTILYSILPASSLIFLKFKPNLLAFVFLRVYLRNLLVFLICSILLLPSTSIALGRSFTTSNISGIDGP